jgi:hypothetical protein
MRPACLPDSSHSHVFWTVICCTLTKHLFYPAIHHRVPVHVSHQCCAALHPAVSDPKRRVVYDRSRAASRSVVASRAIMLHTHPLCSVLLTICAPQHASMYATTRGLRHLLPSRVETLHAGHNCRDRNFFLSSQKDFSAHVMHLLLLLQQMGRGRDQLEELSSLGRVSP